MKFKVGDIVYVNVSGGAWFEERRVIRGYYDDKYLTTGLDSKVVYSAARPEEDLELCPEYAAIKDTPLFKLMKEE